MTAFLNELDELTWIRRGAQVRDLSYERSDTCALAMPSQEVPTVLSCHVCAQSHDGEDEREVIR